MDYLKLSCEQLRGVEAGEIKLAEREIRKQLAELRMDVYTASAVSSGKAKRLRKSLARILTVRNDVKQPQKAK